MDFGHFGDGANNNSGGPPTSQQQPENGNTGTAGATANGTTSPEPVFMHTMEHPGVFCDACEGRIKGFRYKCLQCLDFDLCTVCERKGQHAGHIMMRIAFPEQAGDAIRRYSSSSDPASRYHATNGIFRPHLGSAFGRRHCHFQRAERERAAGAARESEGESGDGDEKSQPAGCPYGLGKKGAKKWAKCMKKMAYQQKRSAETYARTCAQAAAQASGLTPEQQQAAGGSGAGAGIDFTAAASQIQEFLNAFGIPIDVVELYDSYGGSGQQRNGQSNATAPPAQTENTSAPTNTQATPTNAEQGQKNQENAAAVAENTSNAFAPTVGGAETVQPTSNLAANLQQLHINSNNNSDSPSMPAAEHHITMDVDADAGWMLIDNDRGSSNFDSNETVLHIPIPIQPMRATTTATPPSFGPASTLAPEVAANNNNGTAPTPFGEFPPAPRPAPAPAAPTANNGGGMYPVLNPQLQQLLSGVSQAMNSVVRNIPIVTNPSGPVTTTTAGTDSRGPSSIPEMDTKCLSTLNQLLAMGFSNHDGWLSRLIIAKKGDLDAVLNALFPGNGA